MSCSRFAPKAKMPPGVHDQKAAAAVVKTQGQTMLTRRHMQAIAQIVGEQRLRRVEHDRLVLDIARYLESENPRFSMSRFVQAADSAYGAAMRLRGYLGDDPDSWSVEAIARVQCSELSAPVCTGPQPEYNVCLDEQYGEPSAVFAAGLSISAEGGES